MSDHRARYKNSGLDSKELRRRREEDSFQLRKQKRQDILSSKRRTLENETPNLGSGGDDLEEKLEANDGSFAITQKVLDALFQNENEALLVENAQKIRRILSKEPQPPFDEVIQSGLVPRFVELLDSPNSTIQFEVAWCLTNISSGTCEQTNIVVQHNAIPKLVGLLSSPDSRVCEQVVWALGNIIGEGPHLRDIVIGYNFIPALLNLIRPGTDIGFLRTITWVIVNLCRYKDPPPKLEHVEPLIPALFQLIDLSDLNILIDTSWAISYITELGPEFSQLIIDSGLVVKATPFLSHKDSKIQTAIIRALGSIVTGNEEQTQAVIDAGALRQLKHILKEHKDRCVKDALWFLSNIAAGSRDQIQAIFDNNLVSSIVYHLDNGDFSQQKEASWTVYNLCMSGSNLQIQTLVNEGVIPPLCNMLNLKETSIVTNILETLNIILTVCYPANPGVTDIIEECGGLDKIEELQNDPNTTVYELAYAILDKFFKET